MLVCSGALPLQSAFEDNNEEDADSNGNNNVITQSEVKRLKRTISELEEENEQLQHMQLERETEIRIEVSNEMEQRSAFLLEQIQQLQEQLMDQQDTHSSKFDVTRSVKKMKKEHKQALEQDISKHLAEAEEEIERLKHTHTKEIASLYAEKEELCAQIEDWKQKAEQSNKNLYEQQLLVKTLQIQLQQANLLAQAQAKGENTAIVATEFSQRMLRDQRFKRSDDTENAAPINLRAQVQAQQQMRATSPVRSPLGTLRNDPNSPIRLDALNMSQQQPVKQRRSGKNGGNNSHSGTKIIMTGTENDENMIVNAGAPAGPKTRSRAVRA
jgi:chromosome segregation ATPase